MTLAEYEFFVANMTLPQCRNISYLTLGVAGEAGEIAEKVKKYLRDGTLDTFDLVREIGDVFFYLTALSSFLGYGLEEVLEANMNKLNSRKKRLGVLQGSGDNR